MSRELTSQETAERSLIKTYRKSLWNPFIAAVKRYELVSPGDHIAVCVSGGKDSFVLAKLMQELQKHTDRPFALTFSMEDMADWLHAILEREGAERPVLIGQSMGGYLSQVYLERYPGTASGFVSIDSCSLKRKYYTGAELYLLKHTEWMYLAFPWKLLVRVGVKGTAVSEYGRALMKCFMESYGKREYCALADLGYRIVAQSVEADRAYDIRCPALLICGERDGAGSAKRYNREWNRQDGLPLVWVPGAGHNANTDAPETVNREIRRFLSGLG